MNILILKSFHNEMEKIGFLGTALNIAFTGMGLVDAKKRAGMMARSTSPGFGSVPLKRLGEIPMQHNRFPVMSSNT